MLPRLLPLLAGIVPLVAIFGALWIGISNEALPPCLPLIDGCFSISAAGRTPPGSFLFSALMLPQAMILLVLWYFVLLWLRSLDSNLQRSTSIAILTSGIVSSVALIIYVTFLGTEEPIYEFMRRFGIYFGFLGVGVAQIIIAIVLRRISRSSQHNRLVNTARFMLGLCVAAVVLGISNMILKRILEDADSNENRIEWLVFVVMQCYFFALSYAWRLTGFGVSVSTNPNY